MTKKIIPLQKRLKKAYQKRRYIKDCIRDALVEGKAKMLDTNPKKNKKLKEVLKLVKKVDEE